MNWPLITLLIVLACLQPATTADPLSEPLYTEDIDTFKEKKHQNARLEKLMSCWLYICDDVKKSRSKGFDETSLPLLKQCMQKISRKDAVLKITELGGKNLAPVPPFSEIMGVSQIEEQTLPDGYQLTKFDAYLLEKIHALQDQLKELNQKGSLKEQIEQQLERRQKYYLGIIPANTFTHAAILVTISLSLMCCFTWCKFYRTRAQIYSKRKEKEGELRVESVQRKQKIKKRLAKLERGLQEKKE